MSFHSWLLIICCLFCGIWYCSISYHSFSRDDSESVGAEHAIRMNSGLKSGEGPELVWSIWALGWFSHTGSLMSSGSSRSDRFSRYESSHIYHSLWIILYQWLFLLLFFSEGAGAEQAIRLSSSLESHRPGHVRLRGRVRQVLGFRWCRTSCIPQLCICLFASAPLYVKLTILCMWDSRYNQYFCISNRRYN